MSQDKIQSKVWLYLAEEPLPAGGSCLLGSLNLAEFVTEDKEFDYDGFVVLHGTDTMSYTASALSFMLENLDKPVVLTGSQIPLCEIRSDGKDNLISSMLIASVPTRRSP